MGGRVKTLHPKIFGGILARRELAEDLQVLKDLDILSFELVVVNLYPFRETIARDGVTWEEAIEQIDIGGPSLIRAASKNHSHVTVATDPSQYNAIEAELNSLGWHVLKYATQTGGRLFRVDSGLRSLYLRVLRKRDRWH